MSSKRSYSARANIFRHSTFGFLHWFYALLLLIFLILPCYASYQQRHTEITSQIENVRFQLANEYQNITDNFWQLYMPFFESPSNSREILMNYTSNPNSELTPLERADLEQALKQMMLRNDAVMWVAIYCEQRADNYYLLGNTSGLKPITEEFPYWEELQSDSLKMEIFGSKPMANLPSGVSTFAICGGLPFSNTGGKILVGYSTAAFQNYCDSAFFSLDSLNYELTNNDSVIFEYHTDKKIEADNLSPVKGFKHLYTQNGKLIYYHEQNCGTKNSRIAYYASQWEIFLFCNSNTPNFFLLFLLFIVVSFVSYTHILRNLRKEVSVIQNGLNQISDNNLDYRIESHLLQDEFFEIAQAINYMTEKLKHNISLAYYYEIKQRETELSELQSKINPHFLYNTFEILRSRCESNGDVETANLIADMSTIFRGLISSKNFVTLREELAFSKHYLSLFNARYGDSVHVRYNFDNEVLSYGIIKNLFQPIIENYFVHGFDTSNKDNYILISGKSLDKDLMLLTVENNGIGMSDADMSKLNKYIHEPIDITTESYGLKNLHQRLVLFYGPPCGLTVYPNPNAPSGISVQIIASKMTYEQYEELHRKQHNSLLER